MLKYLYFEKMPYTRAKFAQIYKRQLQVQILLVDGPVPVIRISLIQSVAAIS